ncbi:unnamed protein product [Polarella glacialis]|uniref:Uncharacterized protein n=1 Tax=Polarella glacialis TaxID=89957 RepID=A0A813HZ50_POLGL|nr:unnamed protein product [Polarella glacialis]
MSPAIATARNQTTNSISSTQSVEQSHCQQQDQHQLTVQHLMKSPANERADPVASAKNSASRKMTAGSSRHLSKCASITQPEPKNQIELLTKVVRKSASKP